MGKVIMYQLFTLMVLFIIKSYSEVKSYQSQKEKGIIDVMEETDQTKEDKESDDNRELDKALMGERLELLVKNSETIDFVADYPEEEKSYEINKNISLDDCDSTNNIPLFLQWDKRWGYCNYGNEMIALTGCGPTCLSMVAVGLTRDTSMNPGIIAKYSEENGYLDEAIIRNEVMGGHPVIASMRPGDFTTEGHFIVLCGYEDGSFLVNDPNSKANSAKRWNYQTLQYQIKNLWSFS